MSKTSIDRGALLVVDDQGTVFRGAAHRDVIRAVGMVEGSTVVTGGEDGQVCVWRLIEQREQPSEPVRLGKMKAQSDRDERRFRPY